MKLQRLRGGQCCATDSGNPRRFGQTLSRETKMFWIIGGRFGSSAASCSSPASAASMRPRMILTVRPMGTIRSRRFPRGITPFPSAMLSRLLLSLLRQPGPLSSSRTISTSRRAPVASVSVGGSSVTTKSPSAGDCAVVSSYRAKASIARLRAVTRGSGRASASDEAASGTGMIPILHPSAKGKA